MKTTMNLMVLVMLGLFMTACGPKVVSTDPGKDVTDAPWYTSVSATFNQSNLDPSTINSSTFQVKIGSENVPGTIAVNGKTVTFVPQKDYPVGSTYTAILTTGIKNTWKIAMKSDYTWSFKTNHAWKHPKNLMDNISPDGTDANSFTGEAVAMDSNSNAIISWQQNDGSGGQIFKSERRNNIWTHPSGLSDNISPDGSVNISCSSVAMDNSGNAIITWFQSIGDPLNTLIFKSEYRNSIWVHPSATDNVSMKRGGLGGGHVVNMSDNGDAIIVWVQYDNNGRVQVFKAEYRNGHWIYPSSLSDYISPNGSSGTEPINAASAAINSFGQTVIVWDQQDTSNVFQIFKSEYINGVWTHPANISDNISPDGWNALHSAASIDNNGNIIIVWDQYDSSSGNVRIYKCEKRNGTWISATPISPVGSAASFPDVRSDINGNAVIAWRQIDESGSLQVFKSEYRNGYWTYPASIADHISPNGSSVSYVDVAIDTVSAIITWLQSDGTYLRAYMSEYRNETWTNPSISDYINPDGSDTYPVSAWGPTVALDGHGNAVIAWCQYDDFGLRQVFMSEYR